MARSAVLALALLAATYATAAPFTEAEKAANSLDFARARDLYRTAMTEEPERRLRDLAAVRLGNIEWRIFHDAPAAERDLGRVADDSESATEAWIERARIAGELGGNFGEAASRSRHALDVAKTLQERTLAIQAYARSVVEPALRARIAGRCEGDAAVLNKTKGELLAAVDKSGARPNLARLLLDSALLTGDGATALTAWHAYHGITAESALLAPAGKNLAAAVSAKDRAAMARALSDSRLFAEAALLIKDGCAEARITDGDGIAAYEADIHALTVGVDEYYRRVALKQANAAELRKLAGKHESGGRFGAYVNVGKTGGVDDLHYAHIVRDETRQVSQYGKTANLRFIELDGIVSNGFWTWVHDGKSGDGGWANNAIYQVRPMYAGGSYGRWVNLTDAGSRAKRDREIADATQHDAEALARDPDLIPRGVAMRIGRQYDEQVLREVSAKGIDAAALRDAFAQREDRDLFESSIWAHEGRHAIDKAAPGPHPSADLEFTAKLSQVVFAPVPRLGIETIAGNMPPGTSHGDANRRIGRLLRAWMTQHAGAIAGLDKSQAMLLQVDKLTDEQLREAFRSMDPLVSGS